MLHVSTPKHSNIIKQWVFYLTFSPLRALESLSEYCPGYVLILSLFYHNIIFKCNLQGGLSLVVLAPSGEFLHKHMYSAQAKFKSQCSRNRQGLTESNYWLMRPLSLWTRVFSAEFSSLEHWHWSLISRLHLKRFLVAFGSEIICPSTHPMYFVCFWEMQKRQIYLTNLRLEQRKDNNPLLPAPFWWFKKALALVSGGMEQDETGLLMWLSELLQWTTKKSFTCAWALCSCRVASGQDCCEQ